MIDEVFEKTRRSGVRLAEASRDITEGSYVQRGWIVSEHGQRSLHMY